MELFPKICKPLSGLSILLHGVISLPDATSYDNYISILVFSLLLFNLIFAFFVVMYSLFV